MERGYVKVYRSVDQNELLENDNTCFLVFMKLLLKANRVTGTYTTGRNKLAAMCNLNPNTLYSALKRLEASTIIQQQSSKTSTTITICNWWKYQQDGNSTSSHHQSTINTKQEKKKKENITIKRDVLGILNRVTGRNFTVEPIGAEKTKSLFTDEQLERAWRNMFKDEWHRPRMKHLKSEYLLRASVIDQFKDWESPKEVYTIQGDNKLAKSHGDVQLSRSEMLKREYGENVGVSNG